MDGAPTLLDVDEKFALAPRQARLARRQRGIGDEPHGQLRRRQHRQRLGEIGVRGGADMDDEARGRRQPLDDLAHARHHLVAEMLGGRFRQQSLADGERQHRRVLRHPLTIGRQARAQRAQLLGDRREGLGARPFAEHTFLGERQPAALGEAGVVGAIDIERGEGRLDHRRRVATRRRAEGAIEAEGFVDRCHRG